jgi:hypothetical protein
LHFYGVRSSISLELGDNDPALRIDAQHIQPVTLSLTSGRSPPVELERHDEDVGPEDLRMGKHPLLKIGALAKARVG